MITIINRRVDKLRLIKTYPTKHTKSEYNKCFYMAIANAKHGHLKRITGKYRSIFVKEYNDGDEKTTLRFDFGPSKNGSTIAIDFVPRLLTDKAWGDVGALFSELFGENVVWNTFKIQVLELAMDVKRNMDEFVFFAEGIKSSNTNFLKNGTLYLGAKYGKRSFRIYDKRKQLKDKKGKFIGYPLTRIESVHRGLQITLAKLQTVPSPFSRLISLPKEKYQEIKKTHAASKVTVSFIKAIESGLTAHDAYWMHNADARKHLLKVIRPYSLKLGASHKHWADWVERQLLALKTQFSIIDAKF